MNSKDGELPEVLKSHSGMAFRSRGRTFFVSPPAEIGEIRSAYSTLAAEASPKKRLGGLIPKSLGARVHSVSYVGSGGFAWFCCKGEVDALTESTVVVFRKAAYSRVQEEKTYELGMISKRYTGTYYSYKWLNKAGQVLFEKSYDAGPIRVEASSIREDGSADEGHIIHFLRSAENAWAEYLLPRATKALNDLGKIAFRHVKGGQVMLTTEEIKFSLAREQGSIRFADLDDVFVASNGVVEFRSKGAVGGLFSRKGIFQFEPYDLLNAKVFFALISRLHGR